MPMESSDELKKWVDSLSIAEKRFITLLGKAKSGAKPSQQLELFNWLNQAAADEAFPPKAKFLQNFSTVSNRLKDLILDGLRLLHKEDNTDAILRTTLDEIAMLVNKKMISAASRQLKRAKKLALDRCRYVFVLQCIEWEQKLASVSSASLEKLREEELLIQQNLHDLREIEYRHEMLLALVKQFPYHRDAATLSRVNDLVNHELIYRISATGAYLERAMAVNLLGIQDLYVRNASAAVIRYQHLLNEWQTRPGWQEDQVSLLLLLCKFYQSACFFAPVDWKEAQAHIMMVNNFTGLPIDAARDFRRLLYHNQFALALNTGKFDSVKTLIPEIDGWIRKEEKQLTEAQQLSFLCNMAVAEFLNDEFKSANQYVNRILQMPNRKARVDIREFALLLQVVLQFEMKNESLNEYLTRAGKRHFNRVGFDVNFELLVLNHLELVTRINTDADLKKSREQLAHDLAELEKLLPEGVPLLGLREMQIWVEAKQRGVSLRIVFLEEVQKNLAELEKTVLLQSPSV
jgi:hypothetical protein